jgi:excisionase family DNA binding protein
MVTHDVPAGLQHPDVYLSLRAVGPYLGGVAYRTVKRYRRLGMPAYRIGGRVLVRRSELDAWLDRFRERRTPTPKVQP